MTYEEKQHLEEIEAFLTPHWGAIHLETLWHSAQQRFRDLREADFELAVRTLLAKSRGGAHPTNCNLHSWLESRKPSRSKGGELYHMHKILLESQAACPDLSENQILESLCPHHQIDPQLASECIRAFRAAHKFNHKVKNYSETTYLPLPPAPSRPAKLERTPTLADRCIAAYERWTNVTGLGRYERRRHDSLVDPKMLEHLTMLSMAEINRGLDETAVLTRIYERAHRTASLELFGALIAAIRDKLAEKAAKAK